MAQNWYDEYSPVGESPEAQAVVEQGPQELTREEYFKGLARQIEQGLAYGFAEEMEALLASKIKGTEREEELAGIRREMAEFRKAHPIQSIVAEIGGAMLTPYGRATALPMAMAKGAGGGAVYGVGAAEGDIQERLPGGVAGGIAGGVLPLAGRGISEGAQRLIDIGVPLTPGQAGTGAVGSAVRTVEEALSTVPILGTPIKMARQQALRKFGTATFNEAIAPISKLGAKSIPFTKAPREAAIQAEKEISDAYTKVYKRMTNLVDLQDMYSAIDDVAPAALDKLKADEWQRLREQLRGIALRQSKDGKFTPESWKKVHSVIRDQAIKKKSSPSGDLVYNEGEVMSEVQDAIFERMISKNPDVADDIKALGKSYRMFSTLDELVRKKDIEEAGTFLPSQLLSAVRRDPYASARQMRELEVPLQKTARAGQDILPAQLPSSGTEERRQVLRALGYGGAAAGGAAAGAYFQPEATAIGLGALLAGGGLTAAGYNPLVRPLLRSASTRLTTTPATAGLIGQQFEEDLPRMDITLDDVRRATGLLQ